jgi:hypothetical protein
VPLARLIRLAYRSTSKDALMRLAVFLVVYVEVVVLALTSPIASGHGPHRDQLLDPIFPHVHLDAPLPPVSSPTIAVHSPVWGADAGGDAAGYGEALTPRASSPPRLPGPPPRRLVPIEAGSPGTRQDPPPDPPPLLPV